MSDAEVAIKALESYQKWGEWLVGLDLAAIGATALLFGFPNNCPSQDIPGLAKLALLFFSLSILSECILLGNLPSVILRAGSSSPPPDIIWANLFRSVWSPVALAAALGGWLLAGGAALLAFEIGQR